MRVLTLLIILLLIVPATALLGNEELCEASGYRWVNNSNYPATYSFTDDVAGNCPIGWTIVNSSSATVSVVNYYNGHGKVVYLTDDDSAGYAEMLNTFSAVVNGTLELWLLDSDSTPGGGSFVIDAGTSGSYQVNINLGPDGTIRCYDGSWHDLMNYTNDVWYHLKVNFNTDEDVYYVYVDNVYRGYCNFRDASGGLTRVRLSSGSTVGTGINVYFDAVSYSWDDNHKVGDNQLGGCCGDDVINLRKNLISDWHFDAGSGTTLYDSIGGNDGTISGATWSSGKQGYALSFDGNDYVTVSNNPSLNVTDDFTVSIWYKPTALGGSTYPATFFEEGFGEGTAGFGLRDRAGELEGGITATNKRVWIDGFTNFFSVGEWTHVVLVLDGSHDKYYIYKNGNLIYEGDSLDVNYAQGTSNLYIGGDHRFLSNGVNGLLDDFRVYNRALSQREVKFLYSMSPYSYVNYTDNFSNDSSWCVNNDLITDADYSRSVCESLGYDYITNNWLKQSFNYRKNITISNSNNELTDFQININPQTYNTTNLTASYHFNSRNSLVKDYSIKSNYGSLYGFTVGLWHFDEGSGTTAHDSSVYESDGTISGATWFPGLSGNALSFDGSTNYVDLSANGLVLTNDTSLSLWVNANIIGDDVHAYRNGLFSSSSSGTYDNFITLANSSDDMRIVIENYAGSTYSSNYFHFNTHQWYHLVITVDSDSHVSFYVNGDLLNSLSTIFYYINLNYLGVGYNGATADGHFNGTIDEVALYNKTLTSDEVKQLYYSQKAEFIEYKEGYEGKGYGVYLNGSEYISVPNSDSLNPSNDFSAIAWFKVTGEPPAGKAYETIINKNPSGYGYNDLYHMYVLSSTYGNTLHCRNGDGASTFELDSVVSVKDGDWHMGACLYNSSSGNYYLYLDGELVDSVAGNAPVSNTGSLIIGYWPAYLNYFNGFIDEVRIYKRVLNQSEISDLYNERHGRIDYGDVRFYNSTGSELPYYFEKDNSFWVKDSVIPNGESNITMYYGNPVASSKSSAESVFDFYDDFDSFNFNQWVIDSGDWAFTKFNGHDCMSIEPSVDNNYLRNSNTKFDNSNNWVIESFIYSTAAGDSYAHPGLTFYSTKDYNDQFYFRPHSNPTDNVQYAYYNSGSLSLVEAFTGDGFNWDEWSKAIIKLTGDSAVFDINCFTGTRTGLQYDGSYSNLGLVAHNSGKNYWDWIRVRKYSSAAPSIVVNDEQNISQGYGCCGDDSISDDFYNGSLSLTDYFCYYGVFTHESLDVNQTLCEHYSYDYILGSLTGSGGACCGDDSGEAFYNDSLASTSYSCYDGVFYDEPLDVNSSACSVWGFDWLDGLTTGSNSACCGDDGDSDDFYNGSLGSTTFVCQDGYLNGGLDVNQTSCLFYSYNWLVDSSGSYALCCGDDSISDDFYNGSLSLTDYFCYYGVFTHESLDVNQTLCEHYSYDYILGSLTGSGGACCDGDSGEQFYNDSINVTANLCFEGVYYNESLDVNSSACSVWGFDWLDGLITGSGGACCGDDSGEAFYNGSLASTSYSCGDGVYYNESLDVNSSACSVWGFDWLNNSQPYFYLDFSEGSGSFAYNVVGSGYGYLLAGASFSTGKYGSGVKIIDNSYVLIYSQANGARVISMWFKPDNPINSSLTTTQALIGRDTYYNNDEFALYFPQSDWDYAGRLVFMNRVGYSSRTYVYSDSDSWDTNWHHIVVIIGDEETSMYVDGVKQSSTNTDTNSITSTTDYQRIGNWGTARAFNGLIDEVKIFNQPITEGVAYNLYKSSPYVDCCGDDGVNDNFSNETNVCCCNGGLISYGDACDFDSDGSVDAICGEVFSLSDTAPLINLSNNVLSAGESLNVNITSDVYPRVILFYPNLTMRKLSVSSCGFGCYNFSINPSSVGYYHLRVFNGLTNYSMFVVENSSLVWSDPWTDNEGNQFRYKKNIIINNTVDSNRINDLFFVDLSFNQSPYCDDVNGDGFFTAGDKLGLKLVNVLPNNDLLELPFSVVNANCTDNNLSSVTVAFPVNIPSMNASPFSATGNEYSFYYGPFDYVIPSYNNVLDYSDGFNRYINNSALKVEYSLTSNVTQTLFNYLGTNSELQVPGDIIISPVEYSDGTNVYTLEADSVNSYSITEYPSFINYALNGSLNSMSVYFNQSFTPSYFFLFNTSINASVTADWLKSFEVNLNKDKFNNLVVNDSGSVVSKDVNSSFSLNTLGNPSWFIMYNNESGEAVSVILTNVTYGDNMLWVWSYDVAGSESSLKYYPWNGSPETLTGVYSTAAALVAYNYSLIDYNLVSMIQSWLLNPLNYSVSTASVSFDITSYDYDEYVDQSDENLTINATIYSNTQDVSALHTDIFDINGNKSLSEDYSCNQLSEFVYDCNITLNPNDFSCGSYSASIYGVGVSGNTTAVNFSFIIDDVTGSFTFNNNSMINSDQFVKVYYHHCSGNSSPINLSASMGNESIFNGVLPSTNEYLISYTNPSDAGLINFSFNAFDGHFFDNKSFNLSVVKSSYSFNNHKVYYSRGMAGYRSNFLSITNPSNTVMNYRVALASDGLTVRFSDNKARTIDVTVLPNSSRALFIDIFPVVLGNYRVRATISSSASGDEGADYFDVIVRTYYSNRFFSYVLVPSLDWLSVALLLIIVIIVFKQNF